MSAGNYITASEIYYRAYNQNLKGTVKRKTYCVVCGTDRYDYGFPVLGQGGFSDSFSRWNLLFSGGDTVCPYCSFVLSMRKQLHSARIGGVFGYMSEDEETMFVVEPSDSEKAGYLLEVIKSLDTMQGYTFWSFQKKSSNVSHYLPFTTVGFIGETTKKIVITEYPKVNFSLDIPFLKQYASSDFEIPLWWGQLKPEERRTQEEIEAIKKAEERWGHSIYKYIKEIDIVNFLKRKVKKEGK